MNTLKDFVDINSEIKHGAPVLKGTRIPISQIIAELADSRPVKDVAEDLSVDVNQLQRFLIELAITLNNPLNYCDKKNEND